MTDFFSDPAWKISTLLAAALGGFLTIWIGKIFNWFRNQFSKENRRLFKETRAQLDAQLESFLEHVAANPILLILNTLYVAMISFAVIGASYLFFSLPAVLDSHTVVQSEFQAMLCPIETSWLNFLCGKPWPDIEAISNQNTARYLRVAAPALFVPLIFFFFWLWTSLYRLLRAYNKALGQYSIARLYSHIK